MLQEAIDFKEESDALYGLLSNLEDADLPILRSSKAGR